MTSDFLKADMVRAAGKKLDPDFVMPEADSLLPELKDYLENEDGSKFMMIRHPLVYMVPFFGSPHEMGMANKRLEFAKAKLEECLKERDAEGYVNLHERPHRLQAFLDCKNKHKIIHPGSRQFWRIAAWMWRDSENIWQNQGTWLWLFRHKGADQFMRHDELVKFKTLFPKKDTKVKIYRGGEYNGLSWTLDPEVAELFANRCSHKKLHKSEPRIREMEVTKAQVLAYTNGRSEEEIILRAVPRE